MTDKKIRLECLKLAVETIKLSMTPHCASINASQEVKDTADDLYKYVTNADKQSEQKT